MTGQAYSKNFVVSFERKEGRKKERKKERKKLADYTGRGFALSVYVLRSISLLSKRLPLRLHYFGALPRVIETFGPRVCTLAICRSRD